jgi:hypothetical protein
MEEGREIIEAAYALIDDRARRVAEMIVQRGIAGEYPATEANTMGAQHAYNRYNQYSRVHLRETVGMEIGALSTYSQCLMDHVLRISQSCPLPLMATVGDVFLHRARLPDEGEEFNGDFLFQVNRLNPFDQSPHRGQQ